MVSLEAFSELLNILYSAPLDQEQWECFLTRLCYHTKSKNGVFFCADSSRGIMIRAMGGVPLDVQVATEYNERYGNSDPFRISLIRNAKTGVFQGHEIVSDEDLLRSDVYRDLCCRLGLRHATVISLCLSVRQFDAISVWRTSDAGPMDDDCIRLLNHLLPHIQKALEINRVLGITQKCLAGAEAIANATSTATFLLSRLGRFIHGNAAADVLLAQGKPLCLVNDTLAAADPASQEKLRDLYKNVASPDFMHSTQAPPRALAIERNLGQRPLQLLATPLPPALRSRAGADIVILVSDPDVPYSYPDSVLNTLYGFTGAEIEVANALLTGYSLDEIARLRRVRVGTIRIQVKGLLSKTGTVRQGDLVRLLMTLPKAVPQHSTLEA